MSYWPLNAFRALLPRDLILQRLNCCFHSSSVLCTFLTRAGPIFCPESLNWMTSHRVFVSDDLALCESWGRASEPRKQKFAEAIVTTELARNFGRFNMVSLPSLLLAKRERKRLHPWIEEFNLEVLSSTAPFSGCAGTGGAPHCASTIRIGVASVIFAGWRSVQRDHETNWLASLVGPRTRCRATRRAILEECTG